jgi:hypothetical protein
MFCPSCGAEAAPGLGYCKRCGARLGPAEARPKVAGLVWAVALAIAVVTAGGFAVVFGFLIEYGTRVSNVVVLLLGLLLAAVIAVDYLLARQLARLLGFYLRGDGGRHRAGALGARPAALEPPRQPAYGETEQATRALADHEQATRTLDPATRERNPH